MRREGARRRKTRRRDLSGNAASGASGGAKVRRNDKAPANAGAEVGTAGFEFNGPMRGPLFIGTYGHQQSPLVGIGRVPRERDNHRLK